MEVWFIIIVTLSIAALLRSIFTICNHTSDGDKNKRLPPGPPSLPLIGNLIWLRNPISELGNILRRLKPRYGPLITMRIGPRCFIFIGNHSLAHRALVQNGAVFSDRPGTPPVSRILNPTAKAISSSVYGPTWRLLRRNLTHEILQTARVRSHSISRRWILYLLVNRILETEEHKVRLIDHFQYAMFCLLVLMCFGDKLQEEKIREIEAVHRRILLGFRRFSALNAWHPRLAKIVFPKRWKEIIQLRDDQGSVLAPIIRARIQSKQACKQPEDDGSIPAAYVDTLVNLELPEENNRKLVEGEMVSLCSEFLNAGTDTTSTVLQWIMANLVKYPQFQSRLYQEIISVVGPPPDLSAATDMKMVVVEEEDLQKMPYLKAVVLEGLRRHPPGHFVLPHKVTQEVELDGYVIPKNAFVNFMVADMGWDPNVWEDPMEFKPERFLNEAASFDVTGSKEIKMMPFGAGRRICPASGLAILHLEYFIANLIWYFEWKPIEGDEIDLSEKQEFTTVMKNPLCARISPRT